MLRRMLVTVTNNPTEIRAAVGVVFPGVGADSAKPATA